MVTRMCLDLSEIVPDPCHPCNPRRFVWQLSMRYIRLTHPAEGSHNGSAAVLKTAGRKAMQVRVLSPPPFTFNNLPRLTLSISIRPRSHLARSWRAPGRKGYGCLFNELTAVRKFCDIA